VPSRISWSGFWCPDVTRYTTAVVYVMATKKLSATSIPM
jgi:hypothetical protein